jgi:hypothetical protein
MGAFGANLYCPGLPFSAERTPRSLAMPSLIVFALFALMASMLVVSVEAEARMKSACPEFGRPCECVWHVRDCLPTFTSNHGLSTHRPSEHTQALRRSSDSENFRALSGPAHGPSVSSTLARDAPQGSPIAGTPRQRRKPDAHTHEIGCAHLWTGNDRLGLHQRLGRKRQGYRQL